MSLSVEIIDHILSFLRDDYITLDLCSGVFPEELVDRHLYANITIPGNYRNSYGGPSVFLRFNPENLTIRLANNPRIASHVRNVRISISDRSGINRKMASILTQLSRIESTALSGTPDSLPWRDMNKHFQTVFLDHLKLPTIRSISITGIKDFPLSAFDKCKNLRRLNLKGKFRGGGSSSTIQTLSLHFDRQYDPVTFTEFSDILQAFSSTLVNLELKFAHFFCNSPLVLPSLRFPLLQRLLVHIPLFFGLDSDFSSGTWCSNIPVIITLLESMVNSGPSANMYHLSLHLQFPATSSYLVTSNLATLDWPRSIVTLATTPNVCHPIKLYISQGRRAPPADLLSVIKQDPKLEKLMKKAKLQIEDGPVYFFD